MLILGEFIRLQDLEPVCVLLQQDLHTFQKEINRDGGGVSETLWGREVIYLVGDRVQQ
jgi:hypothetical protein